MEGVPLHPHQNTLEGVIAFLKDPPRIASTNKHPIFNSLDISKNICR